MYRRQTLKRNGGERFELIRAAALVFFFKSQFDETKSSRRIEYLVRRPLRRGGNLVENEGMKHFMKEKTFRIP